MNQIIALLSDFGNSDVYAGVMQGVMLNINPQARFVTVTHAVQPHNVRQGAFALLDAFGYFPQGTTFLVVVDPGVGSTRKPIAAQAGGYSFVAPDNGILTYAVSQFDDVRVVELTNSAYYLPQVSNTFHGRDIFAPVAAHLAKGVSLEEFGPPLDSMFILAMPQLDIRDKRVVGEVVNIDQFGNIITSIAILRWVTAERLTLSPRFGEMRDAAVPVPAHDVVIEIHDNTIQTILPAYGEAMRGDVLALVGSNGHLEIAVNQGNAASRLDVTIGDRVVMEIRSS